MHTHGHAVDARMHICLHSLLCYEGLPRLRLLVLKELLLPHCCHGARVVDCATVLMTEPLFEWRAILTLVLQLLLLLLLLLLEHLLLGRVHVLQRISLGIGSWRHRAHQGRVYLSSGAYAHVPASKLLRHPTPRRTLCVGRHAGTHGMPWNTWMTHPSGMPSEVWAHASSHHGRVLRSATHGVGDRRCARCTIGRTCATGAGEGCW